jgi:hypothetical protein
VVAGAALIPSPAAGEPASSTGRPASVPAAVGATVLISARQTSSVVVAGGDLSARVYPSVAPPRPRHVAGYTPHALENMAERHITKAQVEAVIAGPDPGVYQDGNDTWLVTDGILIVIINKNGWIVTGFGKD